MGDAVNAIFELIGGLFLSQNCYRLYIDKEVKGVTLTTAAFFAAWSWWNLYYYPSLSQPLSTIGAIIMVVFNTTWIAQAIYYTHKNKNKQL